MSEKSPTREEFQAMVDKMLAWYLDPENTRPILEPCLMSIPNYKRFMRGTAPCTQCGRTKDEHP